MERAKPSSPALRWSKPLILIAVVWGVYWNALHNPFAFDDWHYIKQNPSVRQLGGCAPVHDDVADGLVAIRPAGACYLGRLRRERDLRSRTGAAQLREDYGATIAQFVPYRAGQFLPVGI